MDILFNPSFVEGVVIFREMYYKNVDMKKILEPCKT